MLALGDSQDKLYCLMSCHRITVGKLDGKNVLKNNVSMVSKETDCDDVD
jgi:hypothetical protein